jgi:hypothetical protein
VTTINKLKDLKDGDDKPKPIDPEKVIVDEAELKDASPPLNAEPEALANEESKSTQPQEGTTSA